MLGQRHASLGLRPSSAPTSCMSCENPTAKGFGLLSEDHNKQCYCDNQRREHWSICLSISIFGNVLAEEVLNKSQLSASFSTTLLLSSSSAFIFGLFSNPILPKSGMSTAWLVLSGAGAGGSSNSKKICPWDGHHQKRICRGRWRKDASFIKNSWKSALSTSVPQLGWHLLPHAAASLWPQSPVE